MSVTAETRRLTDWHRRQQIARSHQLDSKLEALWGAALAGELSAFGWRQSMLGLAVAGYQSSQGLAADYLDDFRRESIGLPAEVLSQPSLDMMVAVGVLASVSPFRDQSFSEAAAAARGLMMRGGRDMIATAANRDRKAVGWRRVTDGDPCTFCAMLVGRGAAYKSDKTAGALASKRFKGPGSYKFHNHCGCSVEVLYSRWEPTEQESGWVESYEAASKEAAKRSLARVREQVRTGIDGPPVDSMVSIMRRNGDFRDSPSRRNKQPAA